MLCIVFYYGIFRSLPRTNCRVMHDTPLSQPIARLPGIKDATIAHLATLDILTIEQLLEHYPMRYVDLTLRDLREVADDEKATVEAVVLQPPTIQKLGNKKTRMLCKLASGTETFQAIWFNQHFLREKLVPGTLLHVTGKWKKQHRQLTVSAYEWVRPLSAVTPASLQPVYAVTEGLTQYAIRRAIATALTHYGQEITEWLPPSLVATRRLLSRREAIAKIHEPLTAADGEQARQRVIYEEFFHYQLRVQAMRLFAKRKQDGIRHAFDRIKIRAFVRALPFELTMSQKQVIAEILREMESPMTMNRLLQGDVGSGKTIVAAVALYACVLGGMQGALMVPTDILAQQHAASFLRLFSAAGIEIHIALLTSSVGERQRRHVLSGLLTGAVQLVVGTHALIQDDIDFVQLGLVVTDEQHRFGVKQRSVLRNKGWRPDVLSMTATPIPRTLAITAFGDMDVSTLTELPKGRIQIRTSWVPSQELPRVLAFVQGELQHGRQAYVICPLIEQSDILDYENALHIYEDMQQFFGDAHVGILHGKLSPKEKASTMQRFVHGEIRLLVATTVVEVGVDVPNATIIVVLDAERFGLSQLHQLRGRVGRGTHASWCILVADPKSEVARQRLKIMTEVQDGFELSRQDLALRGPGDLFGTKQSGAPSFRLADPIADFTCLEAARDDVAALLAEEAFWTDDTHAPLRHKVFHATETAHALLD